jgi:hypothetical protein
MSEKPQTFDNPLFGMRLAPDDQLMLDARDSGQMIEMFLGKPIVPTRIPVGERVGVFLISVGELVACERLHVDEPILVDIGIQTDRRPRRAPALQREHLLWKRQLRAHSSSEALRASELIFDRATNRVHVEKNLPLVGEARRSKSEIEVIFGEPVKDIFAADDPVGSQCVLYAAADVKTVQPSVLGDSELGREPAAGACDRLVCICECPAAGDIQQRIRLNRVPHATTKSAYARVSEFIGETERLSREYAARVQIAVAIDEGAKFAFGAEHYGAELIVISDEATAIESAGRNTSAGKQRAAKVHRAEGTARVPADVKAGPGEGSDVLNWRRRLFAGGQVGSESCCRQGDTDRSEQSG